MSNLSLYSVGRGAQVSRAVVRETQQALAVVSARHEIADAQIMVAGALMQRGVTDIINSAALCAEGIRQVPESAPYLGPLMRSYANIVGEIVQKGSR
jgi:hypothetical protein